MHPVVEKLLKEPIIEQRSDAWFALRKNVLSASNVGQALGVNKYSTPDTLVAKYCGFKEEFSEFGKKAVAHGEKYENEILKLHEEMLGEKIYEFGLKKHDKYDWLGGSPDGISESGILCEYKAPISRKLIKGEVPEHYMCQVQMLLEVFDLERAEYIEYRPSELTFPEPPEINRVFIERDRKWFQESFPILQSFWNKVLDYRTRGDEWKNLLPPSLRKQIEPPPMAPSPPSPPPSDFVRNRLNEIKKILEEIEEHLEPPKVTVQSRIDLTIGNEDPTAIAMQILGKS